jgi:transglutaminase-like putative cysteine protease
MAVTYRVSHRTAYRYRNDVSPGYSQLHVLPRDLPYQRCRSTEVTIVPEPDDYRERTDFFGNRVAYCAIEAPHRSLTVTAVSIVDIDAHSGGLPLFSDQPWERARDEIGVRQDPDATDVIQFALNSPLVRASTAFADYATRSFTPGRQVVDAIAELASRIHGEFAYRPGSTSVRTTLEEVFTQRQGVCQDFAHVAIACFRSVGLAARYVSGYLETDPPPGRPKLEGADVSHAWASVFVPDAGWVDIDPTNDQFVNDRYVTNAWGRDYADVPPMNGVIYTEGGPASLEVEVDVTALPGSDEIGSR